MDKGKLKLRQGGRQMMRRRSGAMALWVLALSLILSSCATVLGPVRERDPEVARLLSALPKKETYPDAHVIYLVSESEEEVFAGGRSREVSRDVFLVVSERGKEYGNITIGFNARYEKVRLDYARTITPEGKVLPVRTNAVKVVTPYSDYPSYSDYKELTFSLPGVIEGAVIDYRIIRDADPVIEGTFSSQTLLQTSNPILLSRYKVTVPEGMNLKYHARGALKGIDSSPRVSQTARKKTYAWEYRDVPQILTEGDMPPFGEVAFDLRLTTLESWQVFGDWWSGKIQGKTEPSPSIRRKTEELTRGLRNPTEKAAALYDYVKREVRYVSLDFGKSGYEPEKASEVFENKYGDCKDKSTLLVSMLKAAGIESGYVLIPTTGRPALTPGFPYPFQFDHAIAAVKEGEGLRFLDPVAEEYGAESLPGYDQDREVLVFLGGKMAFGRTPLDSPERNATRTVQTIDMAADGSIRSKVTWSAGGNAEAGLRAIFRERSPVRIREYFEGVADGMAPGAKVAEYHFSDPADFQTPFAMDLAFSADEYGKPAGDMLILPYPGASFNCGRASKSERRYPILFNTRTERVSESELNVPEGLGAYYLPEAVTVSNPFFEFRSRFETRKNRIFHRAEMRRKTTRIPPEVYGDYRRDCKAVEKAQQKSLLFKRQ
jgi:hypothetical protein